MRNKHSYPIGGRLLSPVEIRNMRVNTPKRADLGVLNLTGKMVTIPIPEKSEGKCIGCGKMHNNIYDDVCSDCFYGANTDQLD